MASKLSGMRPTICSRGVGAASARRSPLAGLPGTKRGPASLTAIKADTALSQKTIRSVGNKAIALLPALADSQLPPQQCWSTSVCRLLQETPPRSHCFPGHERLRGSFGQRFQHLTCLRRIDLLQYLDGTNSTKT